MRTENFKRSVVFILLVSALVFSMISISPLASAGDWTNRPAPGGTTIEAAQGDNFLIRHELAWDEPENGAYTVTIAWINYENKPEENLTFLMAEAYFTSGADSGESIQADVTLSSAPDGENTKWALSVSCPADSKDNRDGDFNVDVWMGAYGVGGVPHIPTDNHPTLEQFAGVIVIESGMNFWNRAPITIKVLGRGVSVSISPSENSGPPAQTLSYSVTVNNTGDVDDNYDLDVSDDAGWGPTLSDYLLEVPAGESRQTTLNVTVPVDALGCTEDNIIVTATSRADNTFTDNDACIAHAENFRSVSVSISPGYQENLPDGNLTYDVTVANTGNIADTYTLENSDDAGWLLSLENTSLMIPPFETRNTKLTVTILENALFCTDDNILVIATSQADGNVEADDLCVAHALAVRGVDVSIQPVYKSGAPGTTIDYTVTVKNTGNAKDDYRLENWDDLGWTLVLSQTLVEDVWPGEDRNVTLNVTIPNNTPGCTIDNVWVAATSIEDEDVKDNENCQAHSAIVWSVDVSISPSENGVPPGATLTYTVTVTNTGSVSDNYSLSVSDNEGWDPSVFPTSLVVAAFGSENATLSVTVPGAAVPCTRDNITVTATSQEDENVKDNASCIAHALSPKAEFSLATLYKVSLDVNLYLGNGAKLVVKFYNYAGGYQGENVMWVGSTPAHVVMQKDIPHPLGTAVEKAELDLTYDDTGNVISTIASFTVRKVDLEVRFTEIPLEWALAGTPEEKTALEIEYMEVPMQWALAPS